MKNIILVIAIAVFTLVANLVNASESLSGNSLTKFGTYQLAPSSSSVVIGDVAYKTWELTYSGTPEKFVLFAIPGEDGNCCFNVRGTDFEIRYAVNSNSFGAKLVDPAYRTLPRKEVMKKVNSEQLKSQEVIVDSPKTQEEYLGLIACFMPLLMN
jgi:hypothetical protein